MKSRAELQAGEQACLTLGEDDQRAFAGKLWQSAPWPRP